MKTELIKEKLKQLNITEETICLINDFVVSLHLNDDEAGKFLNLLEKVSLQHYIRDLLKKDMLK